MRDRIAGITIVAVIVGLGANLWYLSSQKENDTQDSWGVVGGSTELRVDASSATGAENIAGNSSKEGLSTGATGVTVWKALDAINEPEMPKNQQSSSPALGQQIETSSAALGSSSTPKISPASMRAALDNLDNAPAEYLPRLSEEEISVSSEESTQQRFAISRSVSWSSATHGQTSVVEGDKNVWRLRVASSSASSQNLYLNQVMLPPEAELFLTDLTGKFTAGPYTSEDVNNGELWTAVVPGEELVLAVISPEGSDIHLAVAEVNYGYDDFWAKDASAGSKAAACNVGSVCQEGERWENERRSVARITLFGRWLCSATLVNNTAEDLTPYMLTAAHCLEVRGEGEEKAQRAANSLVGYWNFEASQCSDQADGSLAQSQTGAKLRAMWSSDSSNAMTLHSSSLIALLRCHITFITQDGTREKSLPALSTEFIILKGQKKPFPLVAVKLK